MLIARVSVGFDQKIMKLKGMYRDSVIERGAYPTVVFVLGKDKRGVIRFASVCKPNYQGCSQMPRVGGSEFSKSMIKVYQKGYVPCGILRVGKFEYSEKNCMENTGWYLAKAGKGAIIISASISEKNIQAHKWLFGYEYLRIPYIVVDVPKEQKQNDEVQERG